MPDITISIVTHNCEEKILPVIDSIRSGMTSLSESEEDSPDYTIIIVDSASSDATKLRVNKAMEAQPGLIEWIGCKENVGFSTAHNRAITLLKGLYHVVMTPDMHLPPGSLLAMTHFMDANTDVGLLIPKVVDLPEEEGGATRTLPPRERRVFTGIQSFIASKVMRNQVDEIGYATGGVYFFRTEVFLQVHGFDETFPLPLAEADIIRQVNMVSQTVCFPGVQIMQKCTAKAAPDGVAIGAAPLSWLRFAWKWHTHK